MLLFCNKSKKYSLLELKQFSIISKFVLLAKGNSSDTFTAFSLVSDFEKGNSFDKSFLSSNGLS